MVLPADQELIRTNLKVRNTELSLSHYSDNSIDSAITQAEYLMLTSKEFLKVSWLVWEVPESNSLLISPFPEEKWKKTTSDLKTNSELLLVSSKASSKDSKNRTLDLELISIKECLTFLKSTRSPFTRLEETLSISKDSVKEPWKFQFKMPEPNI